MKHQVKQAFKSSTITDLTCEFCGANGSKLAKVVEGKKGE